MLWPAWEPLDTGPFQLADPIGILDKVVHSRSADMMTMMMERPHG